MRDLCLCSYLTLHDVTGLLDYLFDIWPFPTMKICPIAKDNTKVARFKINPKTLSFAKSAHTDRAFDTVCSASTDCTDG